MEANSLEEQSTFPLSAKSMKWRLPTMIYAAVEAVLTVLQLGLALWYWTNRKSPTSYAVAFATLQCFLNLIAVCSLFMAAKTATEVYTSSKYIIVWSVVQLVSTFVGTTLVGDFAILNILPIIPMGWYLWTGVGGFIAGKFISELYATPVSPSETEQALAKDQFKWRRRTNFIFIVEAILTVCYCVISIIVSAAALVWTKFGSAGKEDSFLWDVASLLSWPILLLINAGFCFANVMAVWRLRNALKRECTEDFKFTNHNKLWTTARMGQICGLVGLSMLLSRLLVYGTAWVVAAGCCWIVWSTSVVLIFMWVEAKYKW